ncbi:MAG: tetratricopeptide repeat protein, partial [Myxococcota bacterium]
MRSTLRTILLVGVLAGAAVLVVEGAPAYAQVEDDLAEADRRFEDSDFKKSAAAYDRAIRKAPNQVPPEAYAKRASIYVIGKDFEGGLAFIRDKAKAAHPNAPEILEQEAVILWGLGKKGDAITSAEAAASKKPSAWIAQRMLGEHHSSRDAARTIAAYEAYLQHRPTDQEKFDVMPRIRLGFAYLKDASGKVRGDNAVDAAKTYQKAVTQFELLKRKFGKEPNASANADNGLCAAYAGLRNNDRAITICEQIIRNPKQVDAHGSVWFNLGKAYLAKKQATRARAAATFAVFL